MPNNASNLLNNFVEEIADKIENVDRSDWKQSAKNGLKRLNQHPAQEASQTNLG
jgi:hypothetical protein